MSASAHGVEELLAPRVRVVTAASLFDGHDAAINIVRRVLQKLGAEVIHLGHDRSVDEIVEAAVQEDAHAVAVSSYQGGHMEFFRLPRRATSGCSVPDTFACMAGAEVHLPKKRLTPLRVRKVWRKFLVPEQGRRLGLEGMIGQIIKGVEGQVVARASGDIERLEPRGACHGRAADQLA